MYLCTSLSEIGVPLRYFPGTTAPAKISERQFDIKLSVRKFYKSKERKDWSNKYNYDWKNHARFNEEFSKWLKIMTSVAKKK